MRYFGHRRWLRATALCVHIVYWHRVISSTGPRGGNPGYIRTETVRRLYGNRAMSVQLPCSLRSLHTEIVRSPCWDRPSAMPPTTCLRAYDFFKFVKLLAIPNRRGRGARESVRKSHSCLMPPQGGLAEAARKGGYGFRRPITSEMWTRHKLNWMCMLKLYVVQLKGKHTRKCVGEGVIVNCYMMLICRFWKGR